MCLGRRSGFRIKSLVSFGYQAVLASWGQSGWLGLDSFPQFYRNCGRMLEGEKAYKK